MKKSILIIAIAIGVLSMNNTRLKAEDSDPLTGIIIVGSGCLFGTMVGTTAILSIDSLADESRTGTNNQRRDRNFRINPNTGGVEVNLPTLNNN